MAIANLSVVIRRLTRGLAADKLQRLSDRQLLERFLVENEEPAFEAIVRRHGPMVLRVCWRTLGRMQDAEDAFQATFLVLIRGAASIRKRHSLASWLHGVARRVAVEARVRYAAQRHHERRAVRHQVGPASEAASEELRLVLDQELQRLPEKWRVPLVLCYLEGRTQDEAAGQLQISTRTFRRRLDEARAALARRLGRQGVTLSAGLGTYLVSDCVASAEVPMSLTASIVEAATRVMAGRPMAAIVPAHVAALTEAVMNAIFVNKLKACICAVSLIGVLTCGAWSQLSTIVGAQPPNANSGRPAAYQERGGGLQTKDGPAPPTIQPADKIIDVTQEQVLSAALAADGKFVVAVTAPPFDLQGVKETRIKAWDSKTGELRRTIRDSQFDYCHLAISPSGKQLLVGHGSNMKDTELYDIEDLTNEPRLVQTLANSAKAWSVAFSHDGKSLLIGATDGLLQVYDAKSGEQRWNTGAHDGHVTAVAFSGDGKLVVSAGTDKTVQIRNAQSGGLTSTLQGHTKQVTSAAFSPDGKLVASGGYDGTVRVWDAETGKEVHKISIADASVRSVAFSPDGKTLAIGGLKDVGQTVLGLWNVKTGKQVRELSGHRGGALSVAFSADGMIVMVAGGDGGVGLWRLNRTPERK